MEVFQTEQIHLTNISRIKILGESVAAGRGSSDCCFDGEYIIKVDGRKYFRQTGKKCWSAVLESQLRQKYPCLQVINDACNSMNTQQIRKYLNCLVSPEDDVVILMMGVNNRKIPGGMYVLLHDLRHIIAHIRELSIPVVLVSPGISTRANEMRGDKFYHMCDVDRCMQMTAEKLEVPFVSLYEIFRGYLKSMDMTPEEFMRPEQELDEYSLPAEESDFSVRDWNRVPDGLHPPDSVQELMALTIIESLGWM